MRIILLPDDDGENDSAPTSGGGHTPLPELDRLSNIIDQFNDLFGGIKWEDSDRVTQLSTVTVRGAWLPKQPSEMPGRPLRGEHTHRA